jgi:hypothetical protein
MSEVFNIISNGLQPTVSGRIRDDIYYIQNTIKCNWREVENTIWYIMQNEEDEIENLLPLFKELFSTHIPFYEHVMGSGNLDPDLSDINHDSFELEKWFHDEIDYEYIADSTGRVKRRKIRYWDKNDVNWKLMLKYFMHMLREFDNWYWEENKKAYPTEDNKLLATVNSIYYFIDDVDISNFNSKNNENFD